MIHIFGREINEEQFTNGLKYLIAGNGEEVIASADQYRVFREKLARMEDPRSSLVNLRPVMEPTVCKIRWGPTAEKFLMAAYDDFDAFKMTLRALVDGGGAGYTFRRGLRYTIDGGREVMLTSAEQYYAFLQAVTKMPTKLEGDCPGIAVWPLATGPYLPRKSEEYTNPTSKHANLQPAERPTKMGAMILPSVFSRKRSTSPTASMVPADTPFSRAALRQPTITGIIPSSKPLSSVTIPLRTLASSSGPRNQHSAVLLDTPNEKDGRLSSDSAGSDFSLWSDTGDLAEQLAAEEDPLQINLRRSIDSQGVRSSPRPTGRQSKHVHYSQPDHRDRRKANVGLDKEAIQIPNPPPRQIGRTEKILAAIMTGERHASHTRGLTGKPLLYFTSVFVSLGVFLFGYDQGVMSGIITGVFFKQYFQEPSRAEIGTMVAILEVGAFISSLGVGRIGDMIGRRKTILYGSIIFFIGGAFQTFSTGMPMMILGRIIAGLGVGALSTIVPVYQSEISPPHNRGKLACIEFTGNVSGYAASVWVDYGCSFIESNYAWRVPLMLQCFMGLLLGLGSLIICESPRWLLDNDHDEEGILVIANLYGGGDIHNDKARQEYREIKMNVLLQRQEGERSYYEMFRKYYKRLFIAMSAQALAQLNGINVISYYAPLVFESAGWVGRDAILMTGINGITYLLSTIPPWYLVDRWGRRVILLSGAVAMIISLSGISYFIYIDIHYTPELTVLFVMIYNAAFGASWGPIPWLYPPEILPLSIRAKGASLSTASNWAFNWIVGELTPILQDWIKWRLYLVHAFFCAVSFVLVYFIYPETANIRLEDMDQLFGDATTAMPTPAQHAEVESLIGMRSPVPSLDIRRGGPGHFSSDSAIPGLDINPPRENGKGATDGAANEEPRREGFGGWISRLAGKGSQRSLKSKSGGDGAYRQLAQEDE